MKITKNALEKNFKLIRQTIGMSVNDIAGLLGVSKQTIYNVEQGKSVLNDEQTLKMETCILECCSLNPGLKDIIMAVLE